MAIQQGQDWEGNIYYWDDSTGDRVAAPDAPVQTDQGYTTPAPANQPAPSIQSDQGWTTPAAPAPEVTITPENVAQAYQDVTGSPPPPQWVEQTVAAYSGDPTATVENVIQDTATVALQNNTPVNIQYTPSAWTQGYAEATGAPRVINDYQGQPAIQVDANGNVVSWKGSSGQTWTPETYNQAYAQGLVDPRQIDVTPLQNPERTPFIQDLLKGVLFVAGSALTAGLGTTSGLAEFLGSSLGAGADSATAVGNAVINAAKAGASGALSNQNPLISAIGAGLNPFVGSTVTDALKDVVDPSIAQAIGSAAKGFTSGATSALSAGNSLSQALQTGTLGALTGGITSGIGQAIDAAGNVISGETRAETPTETPTSAETLPVTEPTQPVTTELPTTDVSGSVAPADVLPTPTIDAATQTATAPVTTPVDTTPVDTAPVTTAVDTTATLPSPSDVPVSYDAFGTPVPAGSEAATNADVVASGTPQPISYDAFGNPVLPGSEAATDADVSGAPSGPSTYTDPISGTIYVVGDNGAIMKDANGNDMTLDQYNREQGTYDQTTPEETTTTDKTPSIGKGLASLLSPTISAELARLLGFNTTPSATSSIATSRAAGGGGIGSTATPRAATAGTSSGKTTKGGSSVTFYPSTSGRGGVTEYGVGGVTTTASPGSQALAQALGVGSPSSGTEDTGVSSPETGGTPQNVWNTASLRVKDATGSEY